MNADNSIAMLFYQNLGKLFYAVAFADKNIEAAEFDALKENVHHVHAILSLKHRVPKADAEHYIASTFNTMENENRTVESCYNDFMAFKRTNEPLFSKSLKIAILKTAGLIASAFSGKNKSELIMLAKLDIEFKKDTNEKQF
ncbi:hypothetical protein [Flavivirga eckloniae]|uniref:Co-chaperone DjlA N-terminal domain-containing protein n=1 Tax=Flavivirga eckloniae TaxID=1803846 RepID=A0A2K9PWV7_9FLAO|nr:hypothetical protein [Flavivirga eckloniae]AUP81328.1 hypothetical protein C1H87_22445 [Flavivirga eckloniae]